MSAASVAAGQSVLSHCALRGWSLEDVKERLDHGDWQGMRDAYSRYRTSSDRALHRDWDQASNWALENVHKCRSTGHKRQLTGGQLLEGVPRDWLARAHAWADLEFAGTRKLHTIRAVLQALAFSSGMAGDIVNGVPTVEVGRRSLSIAAGLIPDTTVGDVLAELREMEGSPLLRVRQAVGVLADRYALVRARGVSTVDEAQLRRARVEVVHPAWRIVGVHLRRAYEAVVHDELRTPTDVHASARLGATAGTEALSQLVACGLITPVRTGGASQAPVLSVSGYDDQNGGHRHSRWRRAVAEPMTAHPILATTNPRRTPNA